MTMLIHAKYMKSKSDYAILCDMVGGDKNDYNSVIVNYPAPNQKEGSSAKDPKKDSSTKDPKKDSSAKHIFEIVSHNNSKLSERQSIYPKETELKIFEAFIRLKLLVHKILKVKPDQSKPSVFDYAISDERRFMDIKVYDSTRFETGNIAKIRKYVIIVDHKQAGKEFTFIVFTGTARKKSLIAKISGDDSDDSAKNEFILGSLCTEKEKEKEKIIVRQFYFYLDHYKLNPVIRISNYGGIFDPLICTKTTFNDNETLLGDIDIESKNISGQLAIALKIFPSATDTDTNALNKISIQKRDTDRQIKIVRS